MNINKAYHKLMKLLKKNKLIKHKKETDEEYKKRMCKHYGISCRCWDKPIYLDTKENDLWK